MIIKEIINKLLEKKGLSLLEAQSAFEEIMSGSVNNSQIAAFLTALKIKGENIDEITGAALAMRKFATKIKVERSVVLDTCGTGGDCSGTFNISTISAFVASAAGVAVAKHGNRSVSSNCGSADLLESLGVNINMDAQKTQAALKDLGICFLFAQSFHPAMKFAGPVRKELGFRTIFNILGPLSNPAGATHQLLGVYDLKLLKVMASVLKNLGSSRALIVHGDDGLDEITTTTYTSICELENNKIRSYRVKPGDFGIKKASISDLKGGSTKENVEIAKSILDGAKGPKRDIVVLNSAFALYAAGLSNKIKGCIKLSEEAIDSGHAKEKLEALIKYS